MLSPDMRLVMRSGDGTGKIYNLLEGSLPVIIGRDADSARIAILDSQISRAHCRIFRSADGLQIQDMESRNGTWLNGGRIDRAPLRTGDRIRVGSTILLFEEETTGPDPLVGKQIEGYDLEELIGRGRYGAVYRGTQVALGRPVAIKILADELTTDPEQVQSFLSEARRAGALNHPNLVQVHDVISVGGRYLLVMELMAEAIGEQLRESGPFDEPTVRKVMLDTCAALAFAEAHRLVHRDVKPDNILVSDDGIYKLADLGIAATISDDGLAHQERIFGSPHYVAPEQARGGAIDGRADLYALGATAFHLLTGRPVFEGPTRDIIQSHLSRQPPDIRKLVPNLSPSMAKLIDRLLKKEPAERPRSASELITLLERLAEGKPLVRRVIRRRYRRR